MKRNYRKLWDAQKAQARAELETFFEDRECPDCGKPLRVYRFAPANACCADCGRQAEQPSLL